MLIPISISSDNLKEIETIKGLLDGGASGKFIDQNYANKLGVEQKSLKKPIKVYNVDGTPNKEGTIQKYIKIDLEIHGRKQNCHLLITGLG